MDQCNICYSNKDLIETTCKHLFCKTCIKSWLITNLKITCPMCRKVLIKVISDHVIDVNDYLLFHNNYFNKYRKYKNLFFDVYSYSFYLYIKFYTFKFKDKVYRNYNGKIYKIK